MKSESAANVDEAPQAPHKNHAKKKKKNTAARCHQCTCLLPQVRSNNRARYGEINAMHNTVIQKLNTKADLLGPHQGRRAKESTKVSAEEALIC